MIFLLPMLLIGAGPVAPDVSLSLLRTNPELSIELVAWEPQVIDPVSARFDEFGRLWVVEMRDYPTGPIGGQGPQGAIKVLRDPDGDGVFNHSVEFATGLIFPTGVQPWQGGVIATLSGSVEFMQDTDGDDVCDTREVLFSGFAEDNTQLRANHPTLAPDGNVYIANGLRGGKVQIASSRWLQPGNSANEPIAITGRDFVFNPHGGFVGAETGGGQYGMTVNDFNQRMICSNRNPCDWVALSAATIARDPLLSTQDAVVNVAKTGGDSRVNPLVAAWTTSNLHAGQFTAACGVHRFGGQAIPELLGDIFTCDPTGSLVQRQRVTANGATLTARRADGEIEFLASLDPWFRAVDLTEGPDGNLYVVDMYRAVIEHPDFVPTELKQRPDERLGNDLGRIYRVTRRKQDNPGNELMTAWKANNISELVSLLNHPNRWHRETAGRKLWESRDVRAIPELRQLIRSVDSRPEARSRALYWLSAFNGLDSETLEIAIGDRNFDVQVIAIRLATDSVNCLQLASHESPAVRLAVALKVGELTEANKLPVDGPLSNAWLSLVRHDATDPLMVKALGAVSEAACVPLFFSLCGSNEITASGAKALSERFAVRIGRSSNPVAFLPAIDRLPVKDMRRCALAVKWCDGVAASSRSVASLIQAATPAQQAVWRTTQELAIHSLAEKTLPIESRVAGIHLVRYFSSTSQATSGLWNCTQETIEPAVRLAAIETLASLRSEQLPQFLIESLSSFSPELRRRSVDLLIGNSSWASMMLDALESGKLTRAMIDLVQTQRLTHSGDKLLATRATTLLSGSSSTRRAVIADYGPIVMLKGDPIAGKQVFRTACANCHRIGDLGRDLGPDISDSRTKTIEQLLQSILDPDAAIDAGFVRYTLLSTDGRIRDGLLVDETAARVTLRPIEGDDQVIPREEIEQLKSAGVSLMPTGFETTISAENMRDLIAFIKQWRYLDGAVPANVSTIP